MPIYIPAHTRTISSSSSSSSSTTTTIFQPTTDPPSILLKNARSDQSFNLSSWFQQTQIEPGISITNVKNLKVYHASSEKLHYLNKAIHDRYISSVSDCVIFGVIDGKINIEEVHNLNENQSSINKMSVMKPLINDHFTEFGRKLIKRLFTYGFAAIAFDNDSNLGLMPIALDLSAGYEFSWYHNEVGNIIMELYTIDTQSQPYGMNSLIGFAGRPLISRNDVIFVYDIMRMPGNDGKFGSYTEECMGLIKNHKANEKLETIANIERVNPPMVVEDNKSNIGAVGLNTAVAKGLINMTEEKQRREQISTDNKNLLNYQSYNANAKQLIKLQGINKIFNDPLESSNDIMPGLANLIVNSNSGISYVPEEKKVAHQILAEGPSDMIERTNLLTRQICNAFGLPPQRLFDTSGSRASNASIVEKAWIDRKTALQDAILSDIRRIYQYSYSTRTIDRVFKLAEAKNIPITTELVLAALDVNVTIKRRAKVEDLDYLKDSYQSGLLKHDAYIEQLSSISGFPIEAYESEESSIKKKELRNAKPEVKSKTKDNKRKESSDNDDNDKSNKKSKSDKQKKKD